MLRASTPGCDSLRPKAPRLTPFDQELPPPGTFRPCRSSRLRRFSPLEHRRLVPSCSRPWGSPRFGPVPSSRGQVRWWHPKMLLSCLAEVVGGYHLFPLVRIRRSSLVAQRGRPVFLVAWSPYEGFPSLAAVSGARRFLARCVLERTPQPLPCLRQPVPSRRSEGCLPPGHPVCARSPPKVPSRTAVLPGFRHPLRPQGLVPRSSPLQVSGVSALTCPILPWAWVLSAVPGLKGVQCALAEAFVH